MLETEKYWIVAAMGLFAALVPLSMIVASYLLSKVRIRPQTPPEQAPTFQRIAYESGMMPVGEGRAQFNFRFYLFALLFVIFDVEVVFLLPWAAKFLGLGAVAFAAMAVFIALVLVGFLYEWKKEALEWK